MKAPDKIYIQTNAGEILSSKWTTIPFRDFENTKYIRSDSLQQEKPVSEDLEEAADDHIRKVADAAGDWTTQDIANAFIAGAEWAMKRKEDKK